MTRRTEGQGHSDRKPNPSQESIMRVQPFLRAAAGVFATALFAAAGAHAQTGTTGKQPEPATMVDTAPTPANDRSSMGAVILIDEPVLAQREAMQAVRERADVDTRAMGAGPARVQRRTITIDEIRQQRALDAAQGARGTPK
jgi:hypothetical protein